ncbi:MAG: hypothetical protein R3E13_00970 [Alphaproteobacteria bacterium]
MQTKKEISEGFTWSARTSAEEIPKKRGATILFSSATELPSDEHLAGVEKISLEYVPATETNPHGNVIRLHTGSAEMVTFCNFSQLVERLYELRGAAEFGKISVEAKDRESGLESLRANPYSLMHESPSDEHLKGVEKISLEYVPATETNPHGNVIRLHTGSAEMVTYCNFSQLVERLYKLRGKKAAGDISLKAVNQGTNIPFNGNLRELVDFCEAYPKHPQTPETATPVQP